MKSLPKILLTILLTSTMTLPAFATTRAKRSHVTANSNLIPAPPFTNQPPVIHAVSAVVVDADSGRTLFSWNADERRQVASTQKLLTSLIVIEDGNLDGYVRVAKSDTMCEPVKLGFKTGEVYTRRNLLTVMLVHSMNDVAYCLGRTDAGSYAAFARKMNLKADELGATNSHFVNPNGLPVPGQYSTAHDMARIALAAYANPVIRSIVCRKVVAFRYESGRIVNFRTTNKVLESYSLCNGMKTGYTNAAEHCLIASGTYAGRNIISVVLGDPKQHIWKDSYALLQWGLLRHGANVTLH